MLVSSCTGSSTWLEELDFNGRKPAEPAVIMQRCPGTRRWTPKFSVQVKVRNLSRMYMERRWREQQQQNHKQLNSRAAHTSVFTNKLSLDSLCAVSESGAIKTRIGSYWYPNVGTEEENKSGENEKQRGILQERGVFLWILDTCSTFQYLPVPPSTGRQNNWNYYKNQQFSDLTPLGLGLGEISVNILFVNEWNYKVYFVFFHF